MSPLKLAILAALATMEGCAHAPSPAAEGVQLRKAMARQALGEGRTALALDLLAELYRASPQDPEVLALRGVALREQGLFAEAEVELDDAVRIDRGYAWAHAQLAVLLDLEEKRDEALAHHERAVQLEPTNAGWINNLALSHLGRGQVAEAIAGFQRALRLSPTDGRIRNNLGFAFARRGDFRQAAEQFAHAGSVADARNNLGFAYEQAGNLAQAFELYLEATRLDPCSSRARENLAQLALRMGRTPPPETAEAAQPPEPRASEKERSGEP